MPPESLPWDRKDFFREKKHGNAGYDRVSEPLGGSSARWRDPPSHGSRNDFNRWGFPSDFRRPPGHGKQGSWYQYQEDSSHEYPTARSGERFLQGGGGFRPSGPYRDNRYNRNFRENRASINQRDWRGNSYDYNHYHGAASSGPGRFYDGKDQKSAEPAPARLSRPPMDVANTSNLVHSEEQRDESCDVNKDTCRGVEKEEPLASDWKPFKWSRPVSLTSKGPVECLASSLKGSGESCDVKTELPLKICTPDESFSGDAVGCLTSPTSMEDTSSRKKPRLGWGQGLAKKEKKRCDPDDPQTKNSSAQCTSNNEPMNSPAQNWADKSPMFGGSFECRSPTTPSSVAYSSSPGLDDKSHMKTLETEGDGNKPKVQDHFAGVSLNLQDMDTNAYSNLNGFLTELLQKEDYSSMDSGLAKSALNKLLSWKGDISKVLESTESEIDSLENELKSLKSVPEMNVDEDALKKTKDDCIDSPGTATSKLNVSSFESDNHEACSSGNAQEDTEGTSGHDNMVVCEKLEGNSIDYILFSNKKTAFEASKSLDKFLPSSDCVIESIETMSSACSPNKMLKEKFLKRKQALRFKERLLSMKYRAFRYMWKEDLQLLSERKHRTKSQKKVESCSRSLHTGFQKHRFSVRLRVTSPACNLNLIPTSETVNFTQKLLSDPQIRCYRTEMKMPPLILDKQEKMLSGFLSNNGLIQDPYAVEKERALINPWTAEEKEIFLDKYASFGKDFTKISSFLDHKTTADCIQFYYKNHKSECFKKAKKQTSAPATRYLITSEKLNREMNAASASLDLLGAAKILAKVDMDDERETEAADVLAGICGSLSSEAMSSCITEPSGTRFPPTAEVTQNVVVDDDDDDGTCSDESCGYVEPVDWTDEEKSSFVQAYSLYNKDFGMISRCVQTKSRDQCKVFFSKARKCLGLEMVCSDPGVVENDSDTSKLYHDEKDLKERDCEQEKTPDCPDDGAVLNEGVAPMDSETVLVPDEATTDTEKAVELKSVSLENQVMDFAPLGNELKRSASVNDLHHGQSSSLDLSMQQIERSTSIQPLQVYYMKKCQRSASVQSLGDSSTNHHHQVSDKTEKSCKKVKIFGQIISKPSEGSSKLGLENFPPKRYGTIPDSALILAKYPGIFNASEQKLPLLASVASSSSCNLGFANYLPEVPKNGFEAVPGLKQIELNVVDSNSRSVGSFNGLTDPVAALKLHYAKTHNQRGLNPGGDLGR